MSGVSAKAPAPVRQRVNYGPGWGRHRVGMGDRDWEERQQERQAKPDRDDGEREKGTRERSKWGGTRKRESNKGEGREVGERGRDEGDEGGSRREGRANTVSLWPCSGL